MKYADNPERHRILMQALQATTLEEIEAAKHDLDSWLRAHPDDVGIEDAYEQFALMGLSCEAMNEPVREAAVVR